MLRTYTNLVFFVFCVLLFVAFSSTANAQSTAGIGLKPAMVEETVDPGDVQTYEVEVTNLRSNDQTFYLYKRNISGVRDGGVPIFADTDLEATGYEIIDWVTVESEELQISANQTQTLRFTLNVPQDATPGSHFGAIFVSAEPPRLRESGAGVGYDVALVLSMRVSGDARESAMLRSFRTDKYIYSRPSVTFTGTVRNDGNVLVRPTGPLEVHNMFGKRVALLTFNESEAGVFPNADRDFVVQWDDDGTGFGRYEAVVSPVFGDEGARQTISTSVTFWILPMNIIGPAAIVLAILLFGTYFGVKLYVRRTVMQMGGGRMVRRRRGRRQSSPVLLILVVMLTVTALFLIVLLALFA